LGPDWTAIDVLAINEKDDMCLPSSARGLLPIVLESDIPGPILGDCLPLGAVECLLLLS
jgi:hypothetical protein